MFPPQLFTHSASAVVTGLYLQCSVFLSTTPRDDSLLIFIFFSHVPYSRSSPAYYRAPSTCPQSRIQCVISCLLGNTHGNFSLPTPLPSSLLAWLCRLPSPLYLLFLPANISSPLHLHSPFFPTIPLLTLPPSLCPALGSNL